MIDLAAKLAEVHNSVEFNPKGHTYQVSGKSMVAVTTAGQMLNKPNLIWGAVKLAREGRNHEAVWKQERETGTRVHRAFENSILRRLGCLTLPEEHTAESAYIAAGES